MPIKERLCNRIRQQTENFLQGLHLFVPDSLLALFDESGIMTLSCFLSNSMDSTKANHEMTYSTSNPGNELH